MSWKLIFISRRDADIPTIGVPTYTLYPCSPSIYILEPFIVVMPFFLLAFPESTLATYVNLIRRSYVFMMNQIQSPMIQYWSKIFLENSFPKFDFITIVSTNVYVKIMF